MHSIGIFFTEIGVVDNASPAAHRAHRAVQAAAAVLQVDDIVGDTAALTGEAWGDDGRVFRHSRLQALIDLLVKQCYTSGMDLLTELRKRRGLLTWLADELGISRSAVAQWRRVPAERVLQVERITGIGRSALRPDLYPPQ